MMPDNELVRLVLSAFFVTVSIYCLARFAMSFSPQTIRLTTRWTATERSADMAHALTGLGLATIASGIVDVVPAVAGMLVFSLLAAWFLALLLRSDPGNPARAGRIHGQGGYTLHHLAACGAMIYLFAAGPGGLADGSSPVTSYSAAAADNAVAIGHYSLSAGTNVSWLFGLYFLVAATSLGFRVIEPAVRVTHRPAVSNGLLTYSPAQRSASVRLLGTPAGLCASEVMLSAGLAFVFFSAL